VERDGKWLSTADGSAAGVSSVTSDDPGKSDVSPGTVGVVEASVSTTEPADEELTWQAVVRELVETVVLTLVIFLLIRSVVQNFRIDGISMEPNFHDRQFLIINKLAYRLGQPQRGDVIVFRYPRDPSRDFIKRVIGLPGDTVRIEKGVVYINGRRLQEPYNPRRGSYSAGPITVGPGQLYVLGDNRNNSSDSHTWGLLEMDKVIGKAIFSYWPPRYWGVVSHDTAVLEGRSSPPG